MNLENIKNSVDVVKYLAKNIINLGSFSFVRYMPYGPIQNRITFESDLYNSLQQALELRAKFNLPFWDSFNVSLFGKDFTDYSFLDEIQFHNKPSSIQCISIVNISTFLNETDLDSALALSSLVYLHDGSEMHLQLLDFHIPISDSNQKICEKIISNLQLTGFLINSGKSYHFIGDKLITEDNLLNLLSKSLLFAPILDRAWIAHQLIERQSRLRISNKYSRQPIVLSYIN